MKELYWNKYNAAADLDPFPDIRYQCPVCYKSFKEEYDEAVKESTIVAIKESKIKNPVPPTDPTPQKQKKNPDYKVDLSEGLQDLFMKLC